MGKLISVPLKGNKDKSNFSVKFKEKLDMYDMIVANLIAGKSLIEPSTHLNSSQIAIGFSNIASETQITKYFMISKFPDYLATMLIENVRSKCIQSGVKASFYMHGSPHAINWSSPEMTNKLAIWREYANKNGGDVSVFDYRNKRKDSVARDRIVLSTKYLNTAELDYSRKLIRASFIIEISAPRQEDYILNMIDSIKSLKEYTATNGIKLTELRINMIDWVRTLSPFSLNEAREMKGKISKKIVTDDILANFNSYRQGRIGMKGQCFGIDIMSNEPVLYDIKADADAAENFLITAETGGGKSYLVKSLIDYLLASGFVVTVMDYEGDEYLNQASYIKAGKESDVKIISMGKGSTTYFEPLEIPQLVGEPSVDDELKETSQTYTMALFRVMVCGTSGELSYAEEKIISTAIQRVYDSAGVTDNQSTWVRSRGLRIGMVYQEIKNMANDKEFVDTENDNIKHKAVCKIQEATSIYFEEGESKYGTFANPMSTNELFKAKFNVFSFGAKGATNNISDKTILALKQLSVSFVSAQISNYCKYVLKCFNAKLWEEYQRWGEIEGSSEIIINAMTGGRKRGDVNFLITNNLSAILDENNKVASGIRQNIQHYMVGKIRDRSVRHKFCQLYDLTESIGALDRIAKAHVNDNINRNAGKGNRYKYAFCMIFANGKKCVAKSELPQVLRDSKIFRTGIETKS